MTILRQLKFYQAICEALDLSLARDLSVMVMGLGVPDPKGVFGTTLGLQEKYGVKRVLDTPTSEGGMTGIAIGLALTGMKPVMVHQRLDFALLAVEQIVNQAAKWHSMFGRRMKVPLVIRLIVGRGWGQGPQHSQSLQSWFAHIPGLKVVMPATPQDAKGLLISSVEDDNPVIFIEHRWLHNTYGEVPEGIYRTPLGQARVARRGKDVTIVGVSHMVLEALRASQFLEKVGVEAEVIDIRTLRPLDLPAILNSVKETGHLIVADTGWKFCGFGAELVASVAENALEYLKEPPRRLGMAQGPVPTSPALSQYHYPGAADILVEVGRMLGIDRQKLPVLDEIPAHGADVPDPQFTGPF